MSRGAPRAPGAQIVAQLVKRGKFVTAEPFFVQGQGVAVERDHRANVGDLVLARTGRGRAKVLRRIGRPDVARDVIEALMLDRGLRRSFEPVVEKASLEPPREHPRRDLRDLTTFTIDPASARDFDDAISAEKVGEGAWRIWVHIADVTAYVTPGSAVDREAYRRGTSVYVPGAVEPMLPEALSNRACSLVPGEDRLAVTVEMDLRGARVERAAFHRSTIRSDQRLDYERVDRLFAGEERPEEPWAAPLAAARAAAAALDEARRRRGALVVDSSEPEFTFDRAGHVERRLISEQTESHRVIEHLMIAANEQVARTLDERKAPTLYRVHENPDPERVERLVEQLASLEVPTPPVPEQMSPQQAGDLVADISVLVDEHVRRVGHGRAALSSLVLRSLKRAIYAPGNIGHAGLRSPRYCHFTSPIRRYPDIICHRALLASVGAGEEAPASSRLEEAGAWTSAREREAMSIERAGDDVAHCFLLERELAERGREQTFDGEVVGLIGAGAFVRFGGGYEGMLPVRRLRGEWWELNEPGTMLEGTRTGKAIRLGDPVTVEVERVDTARGRVDLLPVEV